MSRRAKASWWVAARTSIASSAELRATKEFASRKASAPPSPGRNSGALAVIDGKCLLLLRFPRPQASGEKQAEHLMAWLLCLGAHLDQAIETSPISAAACWRISTCLRPSPSIVVDQSKP